MKKITTNLKKLELKKEKITSLSGTEAKNFMGKGGAYKPQPERKTSSYCSVTCNSNDSIV